MLPQEDGRTRETAQDTLNELVLARLIPTVLSLVLWDNDLVLLPLLDDAEQSLRREGHANTTLSHDLDSTLPELAESIFLTGTPQGAEKS
jgi:hypothetical protein